MSFLAPSFIAIGLALCAIPILIHILNRRRFKVVEWAAMKYLLEAMRSNRRRLRFESLLLLLARCAVLFLLALAVARPLGCADSTLAAFAGQKVGLHVIAVDDSYSMAYEADRPGAATHFDQAKKLAHQVIDRLQSGAQQVAIVSASTPAKVIVQPTHDLDAAAAAIDRMPQSFAGTDLGGALRLASDLADESHDAPTRTLHLITDCTASALTGDPQLPTLAQRAANEAKFRINVYDLGKSDQWNQSVTDVHTSDALVRVGFGSDLVASVAGYGSGNGEAKIDWQLDGKPLPGNSAATIKPDANAAPITQSNASFDRPGPVVAEVSIAGGDHLKLDDVRRRVVDVVGDMKVLIVEGKRGMGALGGSGSFLRLALAPPIDPTAAAPTTNPATASAGRYITPTSISDLELAGKPLGEYRAVILAGVGTVTPDIAASLEQFVKEGGSLLMFMGEPVNGDTYNATLAPAGLLPGTLVARVDAPPGGKGFTFDFDPAKPHPLLNAFRNVEKSGLESPGVYTYWRVQIDPKRNAERVLNFTQSAPDAPADPAITIQSLGRGHVVFVATSADADWATLVAKPAYVTLVHELLGGAVGGGDVWMNRTVGDRLELPAGLNLTATPILREGDKRSETLVRADRGDGQLAWRSETLTHPGVFTLESGDQHWPVVVNVPADEANVQTLDANAVRKAMGDVPITMLGDSLAGTDADAAKATSDLSWPILLALLPVLGLESLMAWRFSSRGRATA